MELMSQDGIFVRTNGKTTQRRPFDEVTDLSLDDANAEFERLLAAVRKASEPDFSACPPGWTHRIDEVSVNVWRVTFTRPDGRG